MLTTDAAGIPMSQAFINSFIVALPATVIPILIAAFAAYAFTFMQWPGARPMFVVVVGLLVVPNQVAFVPLVKLYGALGLNGTFFAVWLAHIGFGMPLAIYILRTYMSGLPNAVIESAKIDGASHFTTFWRLIMPMSTPALASFAIFQFLWVWNDLLVALIFLGRGENTVATVALQGLQGQTGAGRELIPAAGFITIIVPILVFLSLQRYFIRGMTSGRGQGLTDRAAQSGPKAVTLPAGHGLSSAAARRRTPGASRQVGTLRGVRTGPLDRQRPGGEGPLDGGHHVGELGGVQARPCLRATEQPGVEQARHEARHEGVAGADGVDDRDGRCRAAPAARRFG